MHDVLDQQLAVAILEIPAVDVDVFRVGMHIGHTRVGISSAIDADIVGVFAPAHRTNRGERHLTRPIRLDPAGLRLALVEGEDLDRRFDHVADRGSPLVQNRIAQHQDLHRGDRKKGNRQHRDDHRQALIDCEMTHPFVLLPVEYG